MVKTRTLFSQTVMAGLHLTPIFNTVAPDVAAWKIAAHARHSADGMMRWMVYIVCEKGTVLTFFSGCLLYKQEIIFLFADIQKKMWESQGEERYKGLCESEAN